MTALSWRERILAVALPIILVAVAAHQVWLATTSDLTPWKGGGFGMFASVDRLNNRAIHGVFETEDRSFAFVLNDLESEASRAQTKVVTNARGLPDERRVAPLAELIAQAEWRVNGETARFHDWIDAEDQRDRPLLVETRGGTSSALPITAVRLDVWQVTYERDARLFAPVHLVEHVFSYPEAR
jgi:hypothetical protein